jgi:hypothetical protein
MAKRSKPASCQDCKHYKFIEDHQGHCRARPPSIIYAPLNPERPFVTAFPTVRDDMACGEFKAP